MSHALRGYLFVMGAAVIWATLGPLTRLLISEHQLSALAIPFLRAALAALALFVGLALTRRDLLRFPRGAGWLLAGFGVVGVGGFYLALVKAFELAGVALAVVLMYTAPVWTALGGALFLHEPLTLRKAAALALALFGAGLVARVYDPAFIRLSLPGVLAGMGASLGYAVFSLLTKLAVGRVDPRTMSLYGFGLGALALLPFQGAGLSAALNPRVWPLLAVMVAGPTLGSWALFSRGLRAVPVSSATIVASIEPVIANLLAYFMFGELLTPLQLAGGGLILAAVVVLQTGSA